MRGLFARVGLTGFETLFAALLETGLVAERLAFDVAGRMAFGVRGVAHALQFLGERGGGRCRVVGRRRGGGGSNDAISHRW